MNLFGRIANIAKSKTDLALISNPVDANQLQAVPWVLYDTQTYVDNTTLQLTYFAQSNADKTLCNMPVGGVLPAPQYFEIWGINCDPLIDAAAQAGHAATGPYDDMNKLVLTGRPTFTLNVNSKGYGPFPLSYCHGSGGPQGFGYATMTAEAQIQWANNLPYDGGYRLGGQIILSPMQPFSIVVNWPAAVNTAGGDTKIRVAMSGVLHTKVS